MYRFILLCCSVCGVLAFINTNCGENFSIGKDGIDRMVVDPNGTLYACDNGSGLENMCDLNNLRNVSCDTDDVNGTVVGIDENLNVVCSDSIGSPGSSVSSVSSFSTLSTRFFTGTRIEIPDSVSGYDNVAELSMSLWINPTSLNGRKSILSKWEQDTETSFLLEHWDALTAKEGGTENRPGLRLFVGTAANENGCCGWDSSFYVDTDYWTHLVVVIDLSQPQSSNVRMYFNGVEDPKLTRFDVNGFTGATADTDLPATIFDNTEAVRIGTLPSIAARHFLGLIDEVSFWTKALSTEEVQELYNNGVPSQLTDFSDSGSLLGWYQMGEGALAAFTGQTSVMPDLSPNANDGTFVGTYYDDTPNPFSATTP